MSLAEYSSSTSSLIIRFLNAAIKHIVLEQVREVMLGNQRNYHDVKLRNCLSVQLPSQV